MDYVGEQVIQWGGTQNYLCLPPYTLAITSGWSLRCFLTQLWVVGLFSLISYNMQTHYSNLCLSLSDKVIFPAAKGIKQNHMLHVLWHSSSAMQCNIMLVSWHMGNNPPGNSSTCSLSHTTHSPKITQAIRTLAAQLLPRYQVDPHFPILLLDAMVSPPGLAQKTSENLSATALTATVTYTVQTLNTFYLKIKKMVSDKKKVSW